MQPIARVVLSAVVMTGAIATERAHAQPSNPNTIAAQLFYQGRVLEGEPMGRGMPRGRSEPARRAQARYADTDPRMHTIHDRGSGLAVTGRS